MERCWSTWGSNIRGWVIFIPITPAIAYCSLSIYLDSIADLDLLPLAIWFISFGLGGRGTFGYLLDPDLLSDRTELGNILTVAALATSITVNALLTGIMVFRIFMVFREVRGVTTSDETSLGVTNGGKLRSVIFIIIESGMAIQLVRLVLVFRGLSTTGTYIFIVSVHEMLNVIILINHSYFISY
jgi:hypothetical protein